MENYLEETYLKTKLHLHFLDVDEYIGGGIWYGRYSFLAESLIKAKNFLNIKEVQVEKINDIDYVISIAKNTPDNSRIREFLSCFPYMENDFSYTDGTACQYGFVAMCHKPASELEAKKLLKEKEFEFEYSINVENLNFNLKVFDQMVNGELEDFRELKRLIVEKSIDVRPTGMLKHALDNVVLLRY